MGILTCASLMVSGEAVDDAVALARENPGLRVGLHLVLIDGFSVLSKTEIPDLVDDNRRFSSDPAAGGARYFFSACARRQLRKESRAQVEKFRSFGLAMDHLNSHHHLHIHPTIAGLVVDLAKEYGIPAIRLPLQGVRTLTRRTAAMATVMFPWVINLKFKLARSGIAHNREVFGLYENDAMHEAAWLRLIPKLKPGVTEIFCHPAVSARDDLVQRRPSTGEFEALVSPEVKELLRKENVTLGCFSDLRELDNGT